jgi:hypothetical protein
MKKCLTFLASAVMALLFTFIACRSDDDKTVAVTGVSLNHSTYYLENGHSVTLVATVEPPNANNQTLSWESDNDDVATVTNDGVVTGVAVGEAIIKVTTNDGDKTAQVTVNVFEPAVHIVGQSGFGDAIISRRATLWAEYNDYEPEAIRETTSFAYSVFVTDQRKVIVAGSLVGEGAIDIPIVWRDGVGGELTINGIPSITHAVPYSVYVSNGHEYVVGEGRNASSTNITTLVLWTDGVPETLYSTDSGSGNECKSVFVSDSNVYVGGRIGSKPTVWVNKQPLSLSEANGVVRSVVESGGILYVAGSEDSQARLWVVEGATTNAANATITPITLTTPGDQSNPIAVSVKAQENTVYVAGYNQGVRSLFGGVAPSGQTIWKIQGKEVIGTTPLSGLVVSGNPVTDIDLIDLFIHGSDIYVLGNRYNTGAAGTPVFWKNNVARALGPSRSTQIQIPARAIFVK